MSDEWNGVSMAQEDFEEMVWSPATYPSGLTCSPGATRGIPVRLITLLSATLALGISACMSEPGPTEAPDSPSLAQADASAYTVVDLGTLGGSPAFAYALAINSAGQVVGASTIPSGEIHAFLWDKGVMTDLGTLGGSSSNAFGINNAGQVVGTSETAGGQFHVFLWGKGIMTDLGTPGGVGSTAIDINARGQILLGGSDGSVGVWERGVITSLALPAGSSGCTPTGINAAGRVIGQCGVGQSIRSELWDRASVTDLGTLGGPLAAATAISASGRVVGISRRQPDQGSRPFLWERGTMTDLSTQGAPAGLIPTAINAGGQIAGHYGGGDQIHAVVWQRGTMIDLSVPGIDNYVSDINASGQVVGYTVGGNGYHAELWTRR
jgi:probable HAF family extracellular repeat protein